MYTYKIACTEEQVKKAYSLGAPLMTFNYDNLGVGEAKILKMNGQVEIESTTNGVTLVAQVPTAEQMIGWLEDKMGVELDIYRTVDLALERNLNEFEWSFTVGAIYDYSNKEHMSRKEATLDALDHVIDYLISKKN